MNATMEQATEQATERAAEFGAAEFMVNASLYSQNRALVDALAKIDGAIVRKENGDIVVSPDKLDSAYQAALATIHGLREQAINGGRYTPPTALGFGSESAATIALAAMNIRQAVSKVRSLFAKIGKAK